MKNEVLFIILLIGSVLSFPYCSDSCQTDDVRCDGNVLEECRDGEWEEMVDCPDAVGDDYLCCLANGAPGCYLAEECD